MTKNNWKEQNIWNVMNRDVKLNNIIKSQQTKMGAYG